MTIKDIVSIVAFCIFALAYVGMALLALFRGKKVKADPAQVDEVFSYIASNALSLIANAEQSYSSVQKGGALKQKDVMNDIKDMCADGGIRYDKEFWQGFIADAVKLINTNRKTDEVAIAETSCEKNASVEA